jgi:hypothetical protein
MTVGSCVVVVTQRFADVESSRISLLLPNDYYDSVS